MSKGKGKNMPPTSKILFLIIGSNVKRDEGQNSKYSTENSISSFISKQANERLYYGRCAVFDLIKHGNSITDGKLLSDLPYNANLKNGPDLEQGKPVSGGLYLPAITRFFGRFYRELNQDGINNLLSSQHHFLIVTGLYGLLTPTELIQNHSIDVRDDIRVTKIWQQNDLLTDVIISYIERFHIKRVMDFTAVKHYQNLISWEKIRFITNGNVLHGFSKQFAGEDLLLPFGNVVKKYSLKSEFELNKIKIDHSEITPYKEIIFLPTTIPNSYEIAREKNIQGKRVSNNDWIGRVRRNYLKLLTSIKAPTHISGFSERVRSLENINLLNRRISQILLEFNNLRNAVEYDNYLISQEELNEIEEGYNVVINWVKDNYKFPENIEEV